MNKTELKLGKRWHKMHCGGDPNGAKKQRYSMTSDVIARVEGVDVEYVRKVLKSYRNLKWGSPYNRQQKYK